MPERIAPPGTVEGAVRAREARIAPEEFARRFEAAGRILWTLAAAELGETSRVPDVMQEAAVIGLQKLDRFEPGTRFTAWIGRIVRFVARNEARKRWRRRTHPVEPESFDEQPDARTPDEALPIDARGDLLDDAGHFDDELRSALGRLRPVARSCLLLRVVHGLSYQEVADVLDLPSGTVVSHVHRARATLRTELADTRVLRPGGTR